MELNSSLVFLSESSCEACETWKLSKLVQIVVSSSNFFISLTSLVVLELVRRLWFEGKSEFDFDGNISTTKFFLFRYFLIPGSGFFLDRGRVRGQGGRLHPKSRTRPGLVCIFFESPGPGPGLNRNTGFHSRLGP